MIRGCMLALLLCGLPVAGLAQKDPRPDRDDQQVMSTDAFLNAHPDIKHRRLGAIAFDEGRHDDARAEFLKAARYGDKMSQAMLAEMAWKGQGQPQDRPLGYAWADLAAERGYPQFVVLREAYWEALPPDARVRAVEVGQPLLDEYADAVARPRIAKAMRDARRYMIAGRPNRNIQRIYVLGPYGLWTQIRGHDFYAEKFWEPKAYEAWTDAVWTAPPPAEKVEVGSPESLSLPR